MGFASTNIDLRPIQTRFPWGFEPEALNQANAGNSPDHYAKGTPSHLYHSAPTACRHIVSGSFPPLSRGSFHLSIALLCTIGHQRVFSLAGWTPQIQSRFHVTRPTQVPLRRQINFAYGALTLYGRRVPTPFHYQSVFLLTKNGPTTPIGKPGWFGLFRFRSPLLTESIFLSLPPGIEMFQFPGFATYTYGLSVCQFGNLRIKVCLTTPRRFSQFSAPFNAF